MTEKEKMISGKVYDACNKELLDEMTQNKDLIWQYNKLRPSIMKQRNELLHKYKINYMMKIHVLHTGRVRVSPFLPFGGDCNIITRQS